MGPATENTLIKQSRVLWEIVYEVLHVFQESVLRPYHGQLPVLFLMSVCAEQVGLTPSPLTLAFA